VDENIKWTQQIISDFTYHKSMKRKVTISIDDGLIREVKRIVSARRTSLASLVREYLEATCCREHRETADTETPRSQFRALSGANWKANLDEGRSS